MEGPQWVDSGPPPCKRIALESGAPFEELPLAVGKRLLIELIDC
jgi:hypothetical protein